MDVFLPKGTRDLLPDVMRNRLMVIDTLRRVFMRFGFEPLETPAFERIETITGKYGDEGEKLIYRILKRGEGSERGEADLALRYDLTVPLARVMAMHPEIRLPFRRYQIQPVWRADRPQKGRFREFWQCDIDIVGTNSTVADAECVAVVAACLTELGFKTFTIRLNDRRILTELARMAGAKDTREETSVLMSLDKLDKIGQLKVHQELLAKGFEEASLANFWSFVLLTGDEEFVLDSLFEAFPDAGRRGVSTVRTLLQQAVALGVPRQCLRFDPTLARGLDYYTGPVFETVIEEQQVGSISGGGRYDGLIGIFAGKEIPAVGVSLGLDRVVTVMEDLGLLPTSTATAEVLVAIYSQETLCYSLSAAQALRAAGISTEVYADDAKLAKQFKYANAGGYPWLLLAGPDEQTARMVSIKNLKTGVQATVSLQKAITLIRNDSKIDA